MGQFFLFLLGAHAQQPHEQKKGHHGGHEIGKGNLPAAAVMTGSPSLPLLFKDGYFLAFHFLISASTSANDGHSPAGIDRLADSMANGTIKSEA